MRRARAISVAALLFGCAAQNAPLSVRVTRDSDGCVLEVEGRRFDNQSGGGEQLLSFARAWPNRRATVNMDRDTPYRCVGGPIFVLQRAGFRKIDVAMDGEPPRARLQ
jgi:hypothetical protein